MDLRRLTPRSALAIPLAAVPRRDPSAPSDRADRSLRMPAARVFAVAGIAAYNWWVLTPLLPGARPTVNAFFSDVAAEGQPRAHLLQRLDLIAATLIVVALVLRGRGGRHGERRREWPWLVGFAIASGLGGWAPYACAPDLDAACRHLERNLALPLHHYIHMAAGVSEFALGTAAVVLAHLSVAPANRRIRSPGIGRPGCTTLAAPPSPSPADLRGRADRRGRGPSGPLAEGEQERTSTASLPFSAPSGDENQRLGRLSAEAPGLARADRPPEVRIIAYLTGMLAVGLPLLCLAFLTQRWGASLEPVFFLLFSTMVMTEVFTPSGARFPEAAT